VADAEAGPAVEALLLSHEGIESNDTGGIEAGRGPPLAFMSRKCSFSWRVSASCRAKGRRHSLQTYGLAPESRDRSDQPRAWIELGIMDKNSRALTATLMPLCNLISTHAPYTAIAIVETWTLTRRCSALVNPFWHTRHTSFLTPTAGVMISVDALMLWMGGCKREKVWRGRIVGCGTL
jgi:hypothetical protein